MLERVVVHSRHPKDDRATIKAKARVSKVECNPGMIRKTLPAQVGAERKPADKKN